MLLLKRLGVANLAKFDFMSPPASQTLARALEQLYALGALDAAGSLTELGTLLADIPVDPQLARCLVMAPLFGCVPEMLTIVSMLSVTSVLIRGGRRRRGVEQLGWMNEEEEEATSVQSEEMLRVFMESESDHLTLLNMIESISKSTIDSMLLCGWQSQRWLPGARNMD